MIMHRWRAALQDKTFRIELIAVLIILPSVVYGFSLFLAWVEQREGYVLNDPLLALVGPYDLSTVTLCFTYIPVLAGFIYCAGQPHLFVRLAGAYALLLILRATTLYLVPLSPPADILPLRDPLLELSVYGGKAALNDLFFSGHTATLFLLFLLAGGKWKVFFFICTLIVGTLVLLQHVHYTVDVLAAPLFAWLAERVVFFLHRAVVRND
jgi:hypothetical protein